MSEVEQTNARDAWNEIAAGYDEFVTPTHVDVAEIALEVAGLQPGMRFLDVAGLGIAENASARYGWPLHVIDDARDDPKLEQPEAFLEALYGVLGSRASIEEMSG